MYIELLCMGMCSTSDLMSSTQQPCLQRATGHTLAFQWSPLILYFFKTPGHLPLHSFYSNMKDFHLKQEAVLWKAARKRMVYPVPIWFCPAQRKHLGDDAAELTGAWVLLHLPNTQVNLIIRETGDYHSPPCESIYCGPSQPCSIPCSTVWFKVTGIRMLGWAGLSGNNYINYI